MYRVNPHPPDLDADVLPLRGPSNARNRPRGSPLTVNPRMTFLCVCARVLCVYEPL